MIMLDEVLNISEKDETGRLFQRLTNIPNEALRSNQIMMMGAKIPPIRATPKG